MPTISGRLGEGVPLPDASIPGGKNLRGGLGRCMIENSVSAKRPQRLMLSTNPGSSAMSSIVRKLSLAAAVVAAAASLAGCATREVHNQSIAPDQIESFEGVEIMPYPVESQADHSYAWNLANAMGIGKYFKDAYVADEDLNKRVKVDGMDAIDKAVIVGTGPLLHGPHPSLDIAMSIGYMLFLTPQTNYVTAPRPIPCGIGRGFSLH